jgi:hypothetical protein
MNEIWERVLANSFSGIHKSKIICSAYTALLYFVMCMGSVSAHYVLTQDM